MKSISKSHSTYTTETTIKRHDLRRSTLNSGDTEFELWSLRVRSTRHWLWSDRNSNASATGSVLAVGLSFWLGLEEAGLATVHTVAHVQPPNNRFNRRAEKGSCQRIPASSAISSQPIRTTFLSPCALAADQNACSQDCKQLIHPSIHHGP